ncbi:glutathione hydrolase 1 proenzyme-like isoform X2 [Gigantopelta aegis]|nr:glutathione hydrolase 1 proenzyme-like isoform X2 [Gigantopelta aegis]
MVIYNKSSHAADVINGRETAPRAATQQRYVNQSFSRGPLSIAVPGEIMAYWAAHQKYGLLPWRQLFEPAIKMARDGHPLSQATARALRKMKYDYKINFVVYPDFCSVFCDKHGDPLKEGDRVMMTNLSRTLHAIAELGPNVTHVNQNLAKYVQDMGGLLTETDLEGYSPRVEPPLSQQYGDITMYTVGAPSGGPVLGLILNIIDGFNFTHEDIAIPEAEAATYHKIIEAIKFSFADRLRMGDPRFVDIHDLLTKIASRQYADYVRRSIDADKTHDVSFYTNITRASWRDFGTSHISVLAANGDAVSVTSTVNWYFGSMLLSGATGIILNNEMADFSKLPQHDSNPSLNTIEPGKQPLSSMCPAVFVNKMGYPVLVVGAAGGDRITTVTAQVAIRILWLKQTLDTAISEKRFHHRLSPNILQWEPGFSQIVLSQLSQYGHELRKAKPKMSVVQAIFRDPETGEVRACSDERKGGSPSFIYS